MTGYQNIIFDIGNVIVRWSPEEIIRLTLGDAADAHAHANQIFQSDIWQALNRGTLTEAQAKQRFADDTALSPAQLEALFYYIKQTQICLYGSVDLLRSAKEAGYGVYALTDNVREIVAFLKQRYAFWSLFDGAIVSAEVGYLKPEPAIYQCLLDDYHLDPASCVFLDDRIANVEGAKALGMAGIPFTDAQQGRAELAKLGIVV
ncbi:HAD family hydrolase [Salinivibrio sp. ML198]|uniref:HAD family hydrolase n=1 Tax=Salinivibrio sp. ML198 TaxID=1909458 RepID=UPI000988D9F0|nr:HAD family phosphatase [Salinivibrio sp. ML198]OOE80958.1 HAD family hydrolase [Salinivibrio sp. ML198]